MLTKAQMQGGGRKGKHREKRTRRMDGNVHKPKIVSHVHHDYDPKTKHSVMRRKKEK